MRIFVLSVLLSLMPLLGNSQKSEPFSRRITYKEGLTTQTVFDLFIHPSGHLYLGTDLGLLRYNGNYFETIPALKNLDNAADNILIDHKDRIWCKNFSNQIFYLDGNQMIHLPELEKIFVEYKGLNRFTHLDGTLYFATTLAIIAYDIDDQKLEIIEKVDNSDEFQSFFLNLTAQENPRSLIYLENKRLKDYFNNRFLDRPVFGFGQIEFEWFEDDVWGIRRALGNELYNLSKGITWPLLGLSPSTSIYFVKNAGGNQWLCTSEGAFQFETSQNKIIQSRLLGKRVTDVVADREGNLWFSTLD
jgi:ligand-binding sensor domain-containing protein